MKVEVLHHRNSDSGCDLRVFVDGVEVGFTLESVDAGAGHERAEWNESLLHTAGNAELSEAFRVASVDARVSEAEYSKYIEGTHSPMVEALADAALAIVAPDPVTARVHDLTARANAALSDGADARLVAVYHDVRDMQKRVTDGPAVAALDSLRRRILVDGFHVPPEVIDTEEERP